MNAGKRYAHIAVLIVAVLLAAFFLCACAEKSKRAPEQNALLGGALTGDSQPRTDAGENTPEDVIDQPTVGTPTDTTQGDAQSGEQNGGNGKGGNVPDDTQSGQTQGEGATDGEMTDNTQQGTSNNGENTDNSAQNNQNGEQTTGQDLADFLYDLESLLNECAPFSRFKAPGEWTIFVGLTEVGCGTFTTDGVFHTTAFTQTEIKLWGTPFGNPVRLYLDFDAFSALKEVELREESLLMQIDLTQEELASVLPNVPEPQGGEGNVTPPEQTQTPNDQGGEQGQQSGEGNSPTQQGEQGGENDEPTQQGEQPTPQQGGEQGETPQSGENQQGEEQNGEQGQQNGEQQGEQNQQGGEQNGEQGQEAPTIPHCPECNAVLSQESAHLSSCSLAGSVPEQSAAATFLSAMPGMCESLSVTGLSAEMEVYSFVLNYLTQEGLAVVKQALRGCQIVYDGENELEATALFGEVGFHFTAEIQKIGDVYRVKLSVEGYLSDE